MLSGTWRDPHLRNLTRSAFFRAKLKLTGLLSEQRVEEFIRNSLSEDGFDLEMAKNVSANPFNLDQIMYIMGDPEIYQVLQKNKETF